MFSQVFTYYLRNYCIIFSVEVIHILVLRGHNPKRL